MIPLPYLKQGDRTPLAWRLQLVRESLSRYPRCSLAPAPEIAQGVCSGLPGCPPTLGRRYWVHLSGRAKASGITLDRIAFHLWTFRDGMPWRCDVFFEEHAALEAAGLSE